MGLQNIVDDKPFESTHSFPTIHAFPNEESWSSSEHPIQLTFDTASTDSNDIVPNLALEVALSDRS